MNTSNTVADFLLMQARAAVAEAGKGARVPGLAADKVLRDHNAPLRPHHTIGHLRTSAEVALLCRLCCS